MKILGLILWLVVRTGLNHYIKEIAIMYTLNKFKLLKGKNVVFNVCEAFEDLKVCIDNDEGLLNIYENYGNISNADETIKVKLVDKQNADIVFHKVNDCELADIFIYLTSL